VEFTAISWNLFHGRDFPPDPALFTWRSRLLRVTECNATHVQVNRDLLGEFSRLLAGVEWDVALLQECPPRWWEPLARACDAEPHGALTSRNSFGAIRGLAARLNPDLIASGEGGSNLTLVRHSFRCVFPTGDVGKAHRKPARIVERRELTIHRGRPERRAMAFTRIAGRPERRTMAFTRIAGGPGTDDAAVDLCVANLHATNDRPELATEDVLRAAEAASEWAGDAPLLFGGDLNLRPAESPQIFAELGERFGLAAPAGPDAIDHLLVRGLEILDSPHPWPPERRELRHDGRALRLSDHAPVEARFATPASR
jgi:endonuclease/exonuclease/phosphatase family metal-dependent hydrolase